MANWIPITIETLQEARASQAINAYSSKAKAAGQPDRAAGLIQGVIDKVRRKIASFATNTVDADPATIPAGLRDLAVDLIIARLKMSVLIALSEDERAAVRAAEADLNRIADGDDTVEQPDTAVESPAQAAMPKPSIVARPSKFSRADQEGI